MYKVGHVCRQQPALASALHRKARVLERLADIVARHQWTVHHTDQPGFRRHLDTVDTRQIVNHIHDIRRPITTIEIWKHDDCGMHDPFLDCQYGQQDRSEAQPLSARPDHCQHESTIATRLLEASAENLDNSRKKCR